MTDPATLRELFEACKSGDLVKVKKLLTPHNVNEIGEIYEGFKKYNRGLSSFYYNLRHGWKEKQCSTFCEWLWEKRRR